jgi:hypothetical protein
MPISESVGHLRIESHVIKIQTVDAGLLRVAQNTMLQMNTDS